MIELFGRVDKLVIVVDDCSKSCFHLLQRRGDVQDIQLIPGLVKCPLVLLLVSIQFNKLSAESEVHVKFNLNLITELEFQFTDREDKSATLGSIQVRSRVKYWFVLTTVIFLSGLVQVSDQLVEEGLIVVSCKEKAQENEGDVKESSEVGEDVPPLTSHSRMNRHFRVQEEVCAKEQLILGQIVSLSSVKRHQFFSKVLGSIPNWTDLEICKVEFSCGLHEVPSAILGRYSIEPEIIIIIDIAVEIKLELGVVDISCLDWPVVEFVVCELNVLLQIIVCKVDQI